MKNPLATDNDRQIRYYEGNLYGIAEFPVKILTGIYIIVISGRAKLDTGAATYDLYPQTEVSFFAGTILHCTDKTSDFKVRAFTYTSDILIKIAAPIDHVFFEYNEEHPIYTHTSDERSQRTWREMLLWMDMAQALFSENSVMKFPQLQAETFLQGFWLWNFSTIQERIKTGDSFTTAQLIANKFIRLVKTESVSHHDVDYYARRLNVSTRYLNKVIREHNPNYTPKQIIDAQLVAEIKDKLIDASHTVTQIAEQLNFPDQSYLSRFFHRKTGMSPMQYRISRLRYQK